MDSRYPGGLAKLGLPALSLDVLCLGCVAAVRSVGWSVWGLFGQCLIKQVDFDSGLAYVLQQWIPFYQWSKSQLYGAWRTHEPDFMLPSFKTCYLEGKLEAGTLFFEIFGPEGRQGLQPPARLRPRLSRSQRRRPTL